MTSEASLTVRVTRRFTAPPENVFDAWLKPELIAGWMFAHTGLEEDVVRLATDPRVGGAFSFLVRRQGQEIDHMGHYHEVDRPRRLVFSWTIAPHPEEGSLVTIDIVPLEEGCELTLTHEIPAEFAEFVQRTEEGWTKMLKALDEALH